MAHFAEINDQNEVLRVVVVKDSVLADADNQETAGSYYCTGLLGGRWIQTSYTGATRKKFAGAGDFYDEDNDGFRSPAPYASWAFNTESWQWEPPVPMPADNNPYLWNEDSKAWEVLA
jgi:hypothetical protein